MDFRLNKLSRIHKAYMDVDSSMKCLGGKSASSMSESWWDDIAWKSSKIEALKKTRQDEFWKGYFYPPWN